MAQKFEAVVVGAGPAGSTAARLLAKAGARVLLLERYPVPRPKLCAGLLSPKTLRLVERLFGETLGAGWLQSTFSRVDFCYGDRRLSSVETRPVFGMVRREDFDFRLAQAAVAAGAELRDDCALRSIDLEDRSVVLDSGERIGYEFLIGADGARSRVRRAMDPDYRARGFCLEAVAPGAQGDQPGVRVVFGLRRHGYGWIFSRGDSTVLGVGGPLPLNPSGWHECFRELAAMAGVSGLRPQGAPIPFGEAVPPAARGRHVILAGDAAGLIDPLTGEGIYFAMRSAELAAQAITQAPDRVGRRYTESLKPIYQTMRWMHAVRGGLHGRRTQRFSMEVLGRSNRFMRWLCEGLVCEYRLTPYGS